MLVAESFSALFCSVSFPFHPSPRSRSHRLLEDNFILGKLAFIPFYSFLFQEWKY